MTLLLALMVPLAANAYVERTVTVYNGIAKNSHIPIEGWNNGSNQPFSVSFSVSEFDLARAGLYDKPISKMAFHVATPGVYTITNNNRYTIKMRNPALENEFTTVAEDVLLRIDEYGVMEINFNWHYTYRGGADLIVNISSPMSYPTSYPDYLPQFYGVNIPGVENGYGTHGNGFKPKITFTYFDEATWANTNRPQGLWLTVGSDGTSLGLSWDAVEATDATYKVCCMPRGTTPSLDYNSSNWVTSQNTLSHTFTGLTPNTEYDLYVCARNQTSASAYSRAMCTTKRIANLDEEGDLELDFDEGFVSNGITCTGNNSYMLDVIRTRYYPWIYVNQYNSYYLNYEGTATATVNLPQITFSGASNGVIMEFDLWSANNLQVKFIKQGVETSLGTFSAGDNKIHYTVRATESLANQNHNAYFQLVSSGAFSIDNIVIYKPAATMKPYNIQASDITTNSATITWDDDNTGNVTYYMRYRKSGTENWSTNQSAITQNEYELTGLDTYCQYEVQMMAYRNSTDYSDYTESFVFATACPATPTTYTQSFTNLSDLPSYWRVATGEGVSYSVSDNRLKVFNSEYLGLWGYTYYTLDAYIILPYFKNLATLQLDFEAGFNWGSWFELTVGVMSDPFDASTFSILEILTLNNSSTTYNISLADAACQHGHIAIKLSGQYSYPPYEEVWFNNFTVTRYTAPTDLTISDVTNTSATLGWTSVATEWEVRYGTDANNYGTPITVAEPTYTITGLTANTEYTAQVRAKYGDGLYSAWEDGDFGTFKTLMQAPVAMNENNPTYSQDFNFINIGHGWMFLNVPRGDSDDYGWYWGNIGTTYSSRYCIYISDDGGTSNNYFVGNSYELPNGNQGYLPFNETTVYAVKTFDLASGQYTFQYDYRVKGVANKDYARVALVPANIALQGIYAGCPSGLSSTTLPEGWIALDGGTQLPQYESTATWSTKTEQYTVLAPGNYMMVFIWHQDAGSRTHSAVQRPIAIDNVSVTWSSLVYPPEVSYEASQATDTEAPPMYLYAPELGIAPTSYEVQYEPALDHNDYEGAPIASFDAIENPQSVTLTGLTPHTLYNVRIRSVYTANGHSVYSDWANYASMFTTKYPRPTNLTVLDQTTSWANVVWTPVEMELPEGQYIHYWWQLTTDLNDWGDYIGQGLVSYSWEQNLAPSTYYFHAKTAVYENNVGLMGESNWSEPITITIAPWTDPVTVFPLIENFEEFPDHFANGLTLDGEYEHLGIVDYLVSGVPTPESGENDYMLRFHSCSSKTAYLVLPPMRPSTSDALVSFWWYHDNSDNNANEGVTVEHSSDGSTWTTWGNKITRYAEETGWVKYQQVIPASGTDPVYIRLRFDGSNSNDWTRCCYLDDLTVNNFKSYQPYISYVGCDASTADITLYDYGYENGWPSSAFQVQYREYRNPGEPEEEWITYSEIANEAPYTFINHLMVTGLQPTTLYEFRACARVSYSTFDFPWSNYCEPYRQWTSCGTYTITPEHSYTIDFEDEFYYNNCWTGDIDETAWHVTTDDAHSGTKSFYVENNVTGSSNLKELRTPPIDLTQLYASTDNVVLRFWVNYTSSSNSPSLRMTSSVNVYNSSSTLYQLCQIPLNTDGWTQIELSLSKQMGDVITIGFKTAQRSHVMWYIDDIEIVANPYPGVKIFDAGGYNYASTWTSSNVWYPNGVPTASDDVMILEGSPSIPHASYNSQVKSIVIGHGGDLYSPTVASSLTVIEGVETHSRRYNLRGEPNNALSIGATTTFTALSVTIASECPMQVTGVANITTLNPGAANSVIVNDGGVLNATTITTANAGENDRVVIKDGGQVKTENTFYATIEKDITGYGAENTDNPTGWNLIATPTKVTAVQTLVPQSGSEYLFDQMDIYRFSGGNTLEWDNFKCPFEDGCDSPWGTIPQGHFSAEIGLPLKGYLYALQEDATIQFVAGPVGDMPFLATNVDTDVNLTCYNTPDDASLNGWNLIGNPYTCNAYLKQDGNYIPFYKMNDTGDAIVGVAAGTPIKPCEGVFVRCTEPGSTVTFTTTESSVLGETPEDPMILLPTHVLYEDQDAGKMMEIILTEGWNWIAPTVEMSVEALQSVLGSDAVIQREEGNTNATVAPGQMVKIHVDEDGAGAFTLLGRVVAANITIENGINWIGYTGGTTDDISAALASYGITPNIGDKIISQDNGFAIYNGTSWEGTLTLLEQGKGCIYVRPLTE